MAAASQGAVARLTDITEDEAKALLMTLDPLAALAGYDQAKLDELRKTAQADNDVLANLWQSLAQQDAAATAEIEQKTQRQKRQAQVEESYYVLIQCDDEKAQVQLFRRLKKEGLNCQLKTC
jgi:hypothetical protein